MQRIGVKIAIDAETSNAKSQIVGLNGSIKKLDDNSRNMPRFMGSGAGSLRPGEATAVPDYRTAAQIMPHTAPSLTGQSMYGVNSFYGQTSPGGILPDGRRVQSETIDVNDVKEKLSIFGDMIEKVTADMQDALSRGDIKSFINFSAAHRNLQDSQAYLQGQLRKTQADEKSRFNDSTAGYLKNYFIGQGISQAVGYAIESGQLMRSARLTRATGDYLGADVAETKGKGELTGNIVGTVAGLGSLLLNLAAPGLGSAIATIATPLLSKIGGFFGGDEGAKLEENLAYSKQYKDTLPSMESFYQRFGGDIAARSGKENSDLALDWYNRASGLSYGTGHTTEELMQAAQNKAAYGNVSGERALSLGRQDLMWERFTGANIGNIQRMSGLAMRYDGDTDAVQRAFAGLEASGMGKGQFDEFLTSMQRIMEDGIEKGFVRGADEIAGNMTMLSKLSGGNALWTGEQGAKRLGQMNEAMYNATNLRTIEDTISFTAVNGLLGEDNAETAVNERELNFRRLNDKNTPYTGTYIDNMITLERGMRPELLGAQMQAVMDLEGEENKAGQIERYRNMFGLNYTGASKIWEMSQNSDFLENPNKYSGQIEDIRTNVEYKSDAQKLQDAITRLTTDGINIGHVTFDHVEMPYLKEATEKMEQIHQDLTKKYDEEEALEANAATIERIATVATPMVEDEFAPTRDDHFQYVLGTIASSTEKGGNKGAVATRFMDIVGGVDPSKLDSNSVAVMEEFTNAFYEKAHGLFNLGSVNERENTQLNAILDKLATAVDAYSRNSGTRVHVTTD